MFSIISATMMAAVAAEPIPLQIELELAPNGQRILCYIDEYQQKRQPVCKAKKHSQHQKRQTPKRKPQRHTNLNKKQAR